MTFLTILGFFILFLCVARLFRRIEDLQRQGDGLNAQISRLEKEQAQLRPAPAPSPQTDSASEKTRDPKPAPAVEAPPLEPRHAPQAHGERLAAARETAGHTPPGATPPPLPKKKPFLSITVSPEKSSAPDPAPAKSIKWRPLLEKLNLWPPSGANAEAALAGWWLTRTGLVLFIIAAVFFGIRISEDVPPWMRVASLGGIAAAVVALGAWLERKLRTFGRLISAGGLALGYFTAFAAYALPPTKVIADSLPAVGVLVQAAALAIMLGWSLWKRDEAVAAMGILLGYISCWFSWHHDLHHFVIPGLLLLATGGGVLLSLRSWLIPQAVASAGSWIGFLLLACREWSGGDAPGLPLMLGSLLALAAILEAACFIAAERSKSQPDIGSSPDWLRILPVLGTSAFLLTGYLATRFAYPGEISTFYLAAAALLFVFTGLRFWRRHHTGLVETYFLKASGLIALFLVAEFDGPVRWLSLSVQSALMLWTWQKTRFLWVEIGFAAIFATALGSIARDLWQIDAGNWFVFDRHSIVGSISLTILSTVLALHGKWTSPKTESVEIDPRAVVRFVAAGLVGITAIALMFTPADRSAGLQQPLALSLFALVLMSPALFLRQSAPFLAGFVALLWAYPAYFLPSLFRIGDGGSFPIGLWLIALGFGLPAAIQVLWPARWKCGQFFRAALHGLAAITAAVTFCRAADDWDLKMPALLLPLFAATIAGVGALIAQSVRLRLGENSAASVTAQAWQWLLAPVIGIATVLAGFATLRHATCEPAYFLLAAAALFAAAYRTKNAVPALAGAFPLLAGLANYLVEFDGRTPTPVHLTCALAMIAIVTAVALLLWKRVDAAKFPAALPMDAALHAISLLTLHWFFRWQLESAGQVFFAGAVTATALYFIARRIPFHTLPVMSPLPVGLALFHSVLPFTPGPRADAWWWAAAVILVCWLWLTGPVRRENGAAGPGIHRIAGDLSEALTALSLTVISFRAFEDPWIIVPLAGAAFLLAILGRQPRFRTINWWSIFPLAFLFPVAISRIHSAAQEGWPTEMLVAVAAAVLFLFGHGIAIAWRRRELRPVTWVHGVLGLGLFFFACASESLGIESWATVCWGIAAIVLFAAGLLAGLRPYRLAGLAGLGLCLGRMFLVDLEDPLFRIYAFFAISIVLLSVGYLYHRFRQFIEGSDA